jgi:hypothetical protein
MSPIPRSRQESIELSNPSESARNPFATPRISFSHAASDEEARRTHNAFFPPSLSGAKAIQLWVDRNANTTSGLAPPRQRKHRSARLTIEEKEKYGQTFDYCSFFLLNYLDSYEKPWASQKDPREKWEKVIFWISILIGLAIGALICYLAWISVTNNEVNTPGHLVSVVQLSNLKQYCLILEDDFHNINKVFTSRAGTQI